MKKADSSYDSVVKDLFQRDRPSLLLDRLTGGVPVRQTLNVEFSRVVERRTDSAFLLEDNTVLHLEFQTSNDPDMAYRQGIYCLLIGQKYRRQVRQAVVFLGLKKMRMPRKLNLGETKVAYTLIDIREFKERLQVLRDLLKSKFRTLPKWANEKLDPANSAQLWRWLKNFVNAKTLEEVLGKK